VSRFASDAPRRSRHAAYPLLAAGLIALATSCDLGTVTVPTTTASLVVHAVLNPNFNSQVVLVERTLTGNVTVPDTGFTPNDPIVSGGGIAVSDALVEILDSAGKAYRGVEDRSIPANNGLGAGVYRIPLGGSTLTLGARYQLHVRTTSGEELTAVTRIPRATVRSSGGLSRTFNRDHDTMAITWNDVASARSYFVRIESPFGPFYLFTDSTRFRTTGTLRNIFGTDLARVFIPGFRQDIVVGAVDSNYYDYYRTSNDPFTGSGIISRVNGGLGLFGSMVELNTGTVTVTADQHGGVEGRFRIIDPTRSFVITQLTLYVESPPARDGLPAALTGRYLVGPTQRTDGIVGELHDSTFSLALLKNQLAGDTAMVFDGVVRGDTLFGSYRNTPGTVLYVRTP
jgi:hypothetical protein